MNVGRVILGSSVVVALGLGGAFVATALPPGDVSVGAAGICADVARYRSIYMGGPSVTNDERVPIVLEAVTPVTTTGDIIAETWALDDWPVGGFADPSDDPGMPWSQRAAVAGKVVAPGYSADIVFHLVLPEGANEGSVDGFDVRYRNAAGVSVTVRSGGSVGIGPCTD